jgi:hypothetical protein
MAEKNIPTNAETAQEKLATSRATLEAGRATGSVGNQPQSKPIEQQTGVSANTVDFEGTRNVVQERIDALSKDNEEGHAKNMERIEKTHEKEANRDGEDRVSGADPRLGREDNGNTPHIDKDGNKSWHPPGVAGAAR